MNVTIRPFHPDDLIGFEFRQPEEVEARRAGFACAADVVLNAWQDGQVETALDPQGLPFLFFARSVKDEEVGEAYVWMLGHQDRIYQNKVGLIRGLRRKLTEWGDTTPLTYTYMNPESAAHIRILKAFGFIALQVIAYNGDASIPYIEMVRLQHGH